MNEITKKPTLAIIDSDMFIFLASWAHRDNQTALSVLLCKKALDKLIHDVLEKINPDFYIMSHGEPGSKCFRYDVATLRPYKEARNNRTDTWSNYFKKPLKDHLRDKWNSHAMSQIESDDFCSIALVKYHKEYDITMVYEDHDFYQIADMINESVKCYNPNKKKFHTLTPDMSRYEWYLQCITGCNGDSIIGIPGIGQDKSGERTSKGHTILAKRADDTHESYFSVVRDVYIEKFGKDYLPIFLENYVLLRMLSEPRFDFPENPTINKFIGKVEDSEKHSKLIDL
jgi:hypothetical protein